ncbi:hypothetical protein CO059_02920 [candidate division WWE3 bacterium CG_4_9_14_0_2_um_filter_48_10]|uniref:Fibronectin type-III domain-containing protein n=1 Tax=candidate division WWE3 bacterium CG_4_9_14_0_2_um_filter_48_10 TaxID=1975078 RepID=A0A2M8EI21_UNCKA|nr:MAG: hypothetical protein CO059_02920 [candidate division WWE3 bacterium CG_4_9_14_0_2_um_filter_48_10]
MGLLIPLLNVQADTTGTLRPIADGGDDNGYFKNTGGTLCTTTNCYLEVDESSGADCTNSDGNSSYVEAKDTGSRITFDVSESSIPDNSTITAMAVTACHIYKKAAAPNTFKMRRCINGACESFGPDITAGATYAETTKTNSPLSVTKTSSTDIEIGIEITGTEIRISQISAVITYTPPDTTPPVITNIQASDITQTTAKITWTTDEPATSQVEYGKTTSYGSQTSLDPDLVTSHTVNLSSLEAGTLYHYRVKSKDANNNLATSSDKTFTTEAGPDTTPPVISSIQAQNISQTGATTTWNTDEPATSQVEYGTTTAYGNSTAINSSLVTFHSVGLSGLTADTTYHYRVKSKDANNNLATSGDKTFTTSGKPLPPEEVEKALPGTPKVEAPKIEADKTPPKVSLDPPSINPTKSATTTFSGRTTEKMGIVSALQFSLNGGKSWHPIKEIKGLGKKKASFTFTTPYLVDGNYEVVVRAFDNSDNIGLSPVRVLVVDVLPPLVGGHIATLGPQVLTPDKGGFVTALVGSEQKIILSAVGGPTKVKILLGEETFPLAYSSDIRLWSGNVRFAELGAHDLRVVAEDGAGNKTDRFLGGVWVQPGGEVLDGEAGKPIEKAEVYLYFFEEVTKSWVLWDAASFGLKNPYLTDKKGQYSFFVPPGRYYLSVSAPGYRTVTSEIVELERGSLLGYIFRLPPRPYIAIPFFGITIHLPAFLDFLVAGKESVGPSVTVPEPKTLKLGDKIPSFTLSDLKGKQISSEDLKGRLFLTFGSVWSPTFFEQAPILSAVAKKKVSFYVVFLQEKASAVETFLKRGGYSFPSLIDKTGVLAQSYKVLTLPQHFFIENGIIRAVEMGVLDEAGLLEGLQR